MKLKHGLIACALVALGTAATSAASEPDAMPSRVLRYTEAELHDPQGARLLYARIRSTAGVVCAVHEGASLEQRLRHAACRKVAIDRAIAALHAPLLTALHRRGKTRRAVGQCRPPVCGPLIARVGALP